VKRALLFITMCVLAGIGGALGSMLGNALGRGGVIAGGVVGGAAMVIAAGFVADARGWIHHSQRLWTILGGVFGFFLACLVALSTLSSPVGPILSTLLVGSGAVLGAFIGRSAHEEA
jgi:uncharacterized membrane-anchored protein